MAVPYAALSAVYISSTADVFIAGLGNSWGLPLLLIGLSRNSARLLIAGFGWQGASTALEFRHATAHDGRPMVHYVFKSVDTF